MPAFIQQIDPAQDGKYTGPVNRQEAKKANPGSRDLGEPVERFAQPVVLLDTPSAAAFVTPSTMAAFAGQDHTVAAQGDLHEAAAHTASSVSGRTTSVFTHDGGIQAIAGNGPVSIRAHTDAMEIYADQDVTIVSVNDEIHIQAKTKIEMVGGQSKVTLDGGNITYACPGTFTVKSSGHHWQGPGRGNANLPSLPDDTAELKNWIEVQWHDTDLVPLKNAEYKLTYQDGTVKQGMLDANGRMYAPDVPGGVASLVLIEREPFDVKKLAAEKAQSSAQDWLSALKPTSET